LLYSREKFLLCSPKEKPKVLFKKIQTVEAIYLPPSKDQIISRNPDAPAHNYNDFHVKSNVELLSEALEPLKRIRRTDNGQADKTPTGSSKVTFQEQVINCFFMIYRA
jgi:hypothetical protein